MNNRRRWLTHAFVIWLLGSSANTWAAPDPAQVIVELGPVETVFDWTNDRCETSDIPDLQARPFVDASGNVQLLSAHYTPYRSIGANLNDVARDCSAPIHTSHFDPDPSKHNDFEWPSAPYTLDGQTIYMIVHNEYHGWDHANCNTSPIFNCWMNSMTLSVSTDQGATYQHAAAPSHVIARSPYAYDPNNTTGPWGFFEGSNIINIGNSYFVLSHVEAKQQQQTGTCLWSTNNLADPTSWRAHDGTAFTIPLNPGICPPVSGGTLVKLHNHLSYNTYLKSYIAAGSNGGPANFHFSTSDDVITWQQPAVLMPTPLIWTSGATEWRAYGTLIQPGDPTRNFERTGRSPYVYYTYHDNATQSLDRDLRRRRVRFSLPGEQNSYDVLSLDFNEYLGTKTLDASFYGHNGLLIGTTTRSTESPSGPRALLAVGSATPAVTVPHSPDLEVTGSITISAFIKLTQLPGSDFSVIVTKDGGPAARNYHFSVAPANASAPGRLHFSWSSAGAYQGSLGQRRVDDGVWHHVAVTYDSQDSKVRYFVDGQLDKVVSGPAFSPTSQASLHIGTHFNGGIDRVQIFNYAQSAAQIAAAAQGRGNVELCNGLDDTGNQQVDEGFACALGQGQQAPCPAGPDSTRTCLPGCVWGPWSSCAGVDAGPPQQDGGLNQDAGVVDSALSSDAAADGAIQDASPDLTADVSIDTLADAATSDTAPSSGGCALAPRPAPLNLVLVLLWLGVRWRR